VKRLVDLTYKEARSHFLKGSSYFNGDLPQYISFEPLLGSVASILNGKEFKEFKASDPSLLPGVNYSFIANKDGRFAWRPYELIHPVIYVSLVEVLCEPSNWQFVVARFATFENGAVECCSAPAMSVDHQSDVATQVRSWWQRSEQRSLATSLEFSHVLHTDVTDCYGALYTHSIAWALHGLQEAKANRGDQSLLGNRIDRHIQASRHGQTNGIAQGSVLMDFVAEMVLGFVDQQIGEDPLLAGTDDFRILRYRDDYRIFTNSDERAEAILKIISDKLRTVGMKLGVSKTITHRNVVEGSIKPDKLAGIGLQSLGEAQAKTIQKQLLRLHAFGQLFPNSGALRRLVGEFHSSLTSLKARPDDLEVLVAIATDIAVVSPATFPAVAGILSHLIVLAPKEEKVTLWTKVRHKMQRVPYNGYLELWLQRVTRPLGIPFDSEEALCKVVNGDSPPLWESGWISHPKLKQAAEAVSQIVVAAPNGIAEVVSPEEVALFKQNAWAY
jgi:RNA-directed DNA polymerase